MPSGFFICQQKEFSNSQPVKTQLPPAVAKTWNVNVTASRTIATDEYDTYKWLVTRDTSASGYRLPAEAEWEYATKGGNTGETFTYSGSDDPDEVAWYSGNHGASGTVTYFWAF